MSNYLIKNNLETERLIIRPITLVDSGFILEITNTDGWLAFIGDRNIKNSSDAENYIQKILQNENYFYNVLVLKETKETIGLVTFLKRDTQQHPDFGFALLPSYEKQGFAYEASTAYLDHLINANSDITIIGITKPENTKSISLLTKLGFIFEENQINELGETLAVYKR
ncbi:MAG TPA: GNAT family N-acetyltransferase [Saprospiraceae bacterium]|nr:GNAT family N-acetyltransferase [Saprospiraceae bacterium]